MHRPKEPTRARYRAPGYGSRARRMLLALALAVHAPSPAGAGKGTPLIGYSATAPQPVIEYTLVHSLLAENDPVPLLRVYGNGRVLVHRPVYMKNSGDFELQLSRADLDALLQSLADDGVMDFDSGTARAERQRLVAREHAASGMLQLVSDDTDTLITVRLDAYRTGTAAPLVRNLRQHVRWSNLDLDARRFPDADRLTHMAAGARRLHALLEHGALRRIP